MSSASYSWKRYNGNFSLAISLLLPSGFISFLLLTFELGNDLWTDRLMEYSLNREWRFYVLLFLLLFHITSVSEFGHSCRFSQLIFALPIFFGSVFCSSFRMFGFVFLVSPKRKLNHMTVYSLFRTFKFMYPFSPLYILMYCFHLVETCDNHIIRCALCI